MRLRHCFLLEQLSQHCSYKQRAKPWGKGTSYRNCLPWQVSSHEGRIMMPTIQVNGTELAYVEQGQGHPLVMVHGSLSDYRSWDRQMEPFAQQYRAIAYSRRYHHPNPCGGYELDYSPMLHADDLAAFISALGLGRAHILGDSYGAYTVLFCAAHHPELVQTLVLGEPPILPLLESSAEGRALRASFLGGAWEPAGQALQKGAFEQGMRVFVDGVSETGAFDQIPLADRAAMLDNALEMKAETASPGAFPAFSCEDARRIMAPALLLTGERSPRMFHLITDELARCLPNCQRVQIADAGHAIHSWNPLAYNETVLAFLGRHAAAAQPIHNM
jgi:non-heme chloroperoxidase